jgi:hypothetical protein
VAGYKALIFTVDAPVLGRRLNEKRNKLKLPDHLTLPNLEGGHYTDSNGDIQPLPQRSHHNPGKDASLSWENAIPWVKANTKLEIWLKGGKSLISHSFFVVNIYTIANPIFHSLLFGGCSTCYTSRSRWRDCIKPRWKAT